jgi:hypothetical protein
MAKPSTLNDLLDCSINNISIVISAPIHSNGDKDWTGYFRGSGGSVKEEISVNVPIRIFVKEG